MQGYTRVCLVGNLAREPILSCTSGGVAITKCSIAVGHGRTRHDEEREQVSFFELVAFGKTAENMALHTAKGHRVLIEGRLKQQRWQMESGENRSKVEVIVDYVVFLQPRSQTDSTGVDAEGFNTITVEP